MKIIIFHLWCRSVKAQAFFFSFYFSLGSMLWLLFCGDVLKVCFSYKEYLFLTGYTIFCSVQNTHVCENLRKCKKYIYKFLFYLRIWKNMRMVYHKRVWFTCKYVRSRIKTCGPREWVFVVAFQHTNVRALAGTRIWMGVSTYVRLRMRRIIHVHVNLWIVYVRIFYPWNNVGGFF